jgi:hypothetical protein
MYQVLIPKIHTGMAVHQNLTSAVLHAVGELALAVDPARMKIYEATLLPLLLGTV